MGGRPRWARAALESYRRTSWPLVAGAWTLVEVFDVGRAWLTARLSGCPPPGPRFVALSIASSAIWAALTPLVLLLSRELPIERGAWRGRVALHAAAALGIASLDVWFLTLLDRAIPDGPRLRLDGQILFDVAVYVAVGGLAHAGRYRGLWAERRQRAAELEGQLAQARLQALEMQLRPHFLFNTLHSLAWLVRDWRNDDAVRAIVALGGLLRATLERDGSAEVPLRDELTFARQYLELQDIRFGDRLRVEIAVAADVEDALVPSLVLQPLVENAVRHGVEDSAEPVGIAIRAGAHEGRLRLSVSNSRGGAAGGRRVDDGIGLRNTRARLEALYGERHSIELRELGGGGAEARLEIPLRRGAS